MSETPILEGRTDFKTNMHIKVLNMGLGPMYQYGITSPQSKQDLSYKVIESNIEEI